MKGGGELGYFDWQMIKSRAYIIMGPWRWGRGSDILLLKKPGEGKRVARMGGAGVSKKT